MNIFYLHNNVTTCAQYHVDKHVVKMILEYCQLLSTAHRIIDGTKTEIITPSGKKKTIYLLPSETFIWEQYKESYIDKDTYIKKYKNVYKLNLSSVIYVQTHANHPSAIWVRKSGFNYQWLYSLLVALCKEYTHRYGKQHSCERLLPALSRPPKNILWNFFTEPTPAMPDHYKISGNSIQSYKNYYVGDKQIMAKWKNRDKPDWYILQ